MSSSCLETSNNCVHSSFCEKLKKDVTSSKVWHAQKLELSKYWHLIEVQSDDYVHKLSLNEGLEMCWMSRRGVKKKTENVEIAEK